MISLGEKNLEREEEQKLAVKYRIFIGWIEEKDQAFELNHITNIKITKRRREKKNYQTLDMKCVDKYLILLKSIYVLLLYLTDYSS